MIKINLVPIDELENQLWWVPDVAVLVVFAFLSFFGAQWYLGEIQKEIDETTAKASSLEDSAKQLEPEIERFKDLSKKKVVLNEKLDSLKKITVTKISRFEPVIVLEHFQNLKPEGVWFSELKVGVPEKGLFSVKGQGFDNLLIAEFITGVRATENQEKDDADLRTHVHFSSLKLKGSAISNNNSSFPEMGIYPDFELSGAIRDKSGALVPANVGDPSLTTPPGGMPPVSAAEQKQRSKLRF